MAPVNAGLVWGVCDKVVVAAVAVTDEVVVDQTGFERSEVASRR